MFGTKASNPLSPATSTLREPDHLRELEEKIALEKGINSEALRRMLKRVAEYGERHKAMGLPDELLQILQEEMKISSAAEG